MAQLPGTAGGAAPQALTPMYAVAMQMKFLLDTPEKLWAALDARAFFKATRLYLVAQTINSNLNVETDEDIVRVLQTFPLLQRQWASLRNFRESILKNARATLEQNAPVATFLRWVCRWVGGWGSQRMNVSGNQERERKKAKQG